MVEIRVQIPDELVQKLQEKLGGNTKATDIAREALTLFNWAVEERGRGRVVLSTDEDGEKVARLAMPSLDRITKQGT